MQKLYPFMSAFPLPIFFFPQSLLTPAVKQRRLMNGSCDPHVQFFPWLHTEWHFLREGHLSISTCSCAASKVLCAFHFSLVLFFLNSSTSNFMENPAGDVDIKFSLWCNSIHRKSWKDNLAIYQHVISILFMTNTVET